MELQHAEGDTAIYEADTDRVTCRPGEGFRSGERAVCGSCVTFDQGTGDATAEGSVRVSYLQQGSTGKPVHVIAARAIGHKATGITQFFSGANGNAKMWQAGSQVEAPVLDFDRSKRTVLAHGAGNTPGGGGEDGARGYERTERQDAAEAGCQEAAEQCASAGIEPHDAVYRCDARGIVRGLVQVNDQDGILRSQEATVYLTPKDAAAPKDARADRAERQGGIT